MERGKQEGFIGILILLIIGLILLKYFLNWSVFEAAATPQGQETVSYTHQLFTTIWSYIATPVTFTWNKIIWPFLILAWKNFQAFLEWGQHPTAACCSAH